MDKNLKEIMDKIDEVLEMKPQVERLHRRVIGDEDFKQPGLIDQVNDHQKFIDKEKKGRKQRSALRGAMALIGELPIVTGKQ